MRRLTILVVCIAVLAMHTTITAQTRKGSLYGWAVVLDPGHGGMDPGASEMFQGKRVVEDEYVFDVALRVQRLIRSMGGLTFMTIQDRTGQRNWSPQQVFPDLRTETYTLNRAAVRAGTWGLNQRLRYGNLINGRYPKHRRAWISIHFDVLGRNEDIEGVRIITPRQSRLSTALGKSFGKYNRLRDVNPIVLNGDRRYGLRSLYILNGGNRIGEKVLIELGNFNNTADVWRIRNHVVREAYARAIAEALAAW